MGTRGFLRRSGSGKGRLEVRVSIIATIIVLVAAGVVVEVVFKGFWLEISS